MICDFSYRPVPATRSMDIRSQTQVICLCVECSRLSCDARLRNANTIWSTNVFLKRMTLFEPKPKLRLTPASTPFQTVPALLPFAELWHRLPSLSSLLTPLIYIFNIHVSL